MSNKVAFEMYTKSDYIVYRKIIDYYTGGDKDEDAFGKPTFSNELPFLSPFRRALN